MADNAVRTTKSPDRRTFLKIGAGVVAGAAIATVVEVPYYSSVLGGNSGSSSSTVSSLKSELSSTQEQLSSTAAQLNAAQGQVTSLNNQLSSTQAQLTSANSQLSGVNSQLTSTQQALTSANGQISTLNGQVTSLTGQLSTVNSSLTSAQGQVSTLQTEISTTAGFLALTSSQQVLVEALAETIIPSDSNGPGAKEAGVIYFIDRQLATDYGNTANMYMRGPFVAPNQQQSITVDGITYSAGTPTLSLSSHHYYQHALSLKQFWNVGLQYLEAYSTTAYGGNYETLSATNQAQVLTDLWNNKPTNFSGMTPQEFYAEVQSLVWAGFFTDPLYGGNKGMVGWTLIGFPGLNQGDFYGEGYTMKQLIVGSTPVPLKPVSIAQLQQMNS